MGNIVTISAAAQFYLLLMCCCFAIAYFILCRRVVWICLLFLASPLSAPPEILLFFFSSSSFSYIELPSIICLSLSGHLIETTDVAGNQTHLLTKQLVQEDELCSVSALCCSL